MAKTSLEPTGERFVTTGTLAQVQVAYEHLHRYFFAQEICARKVVLDIASGEGYGANLLAQSASRVIGVDISRDAVSYARGRYRRDNLSFVTGDCARIPLGRNSVDVVVSFETIEHITNHERFLSQIQRVLRPGGLLVISSPDKHEMTDRNGQINPFHVAELYRKDFLDLLRRHFKFVRGFQQRLVAGSYLAADDHAKGSYIYGTHRGSLQGGTFNEGVHEGMYTLAICSSKSITMKIPLGIFENRLESAQIWDWYERGAQFREESNSLRQELGAARDAAANARRELDDARLKLELLETRTRDLDREVVARGEWGLRLDGEIEALRKIVADQRTLNESQEKQRIDEDTVARRTIAELELRLHDVQASATAEIDKLLAREAERTRESTKDGESIGRLTAEVNELRGVVSRQRSAIEQIEIEKANAIADITTQLELYRRNSEESQAASTRQVATLEFRATELQEEATARAESEARLVRETEVLTRANADLQIAMASLESARALADERIHEHVARISALDAEVARYGLTAVQLSAEVDGLQHALMESRNEQVSLIRQHGEALALHDVEMKQARKDWENWKADALIQSTAVNAELQRLVMSVNLAESRLLKTQEEFSSLSFDAEQTRILADNLDAEITALRSAVVDRDRGIQVLREKVQELFRYSRALEEDISKKDAELHRQMNSSGNTL